MKKYLNYIIIGVALITLIASFYLNISSGPTMDENIKVGTKIEEISMPSLYGEMLSTEDLKGKIVLIDIWASWCRPCRLENPNLVQTYAQYHNQIFKNADGFEIYSISIDQDKLSWERAIKKDQLSWNYHVNDFKGWNSPIIEKFKIEGIPSNILIDKNGKVIATNLRGKELGKELEKLLK